MIGATESLGPASRFVALLALPLAFPVCVCSAAAPRFVAPDRPAGLSKCLVCCVEWAPGSLAALPRAQWIALVLWLAVSLVVAPRFASL